MSPIALIPDWSVVPTEFTSLSVSFSLSLSLSRFLDVSANYPFSRRCLFVSLPSFFSLLSTLSLSLSFSLLPIFSLPQTTRTYYCLVNERQKKVVVRRKFSSCVRACAFSLSLKRNTSFLLVVIILINDNDGNFDSFLLFLFTLLNEPIHISFPLPL